MKKYKLWKILTIVFAFFLAVMIVANIVCGMYEGTINWALNTVSSEIVLGDETGPIYYESEFARKNADGTSQKDEDGKEIIDGAALAAAGDAIVQEVAREGIVLLKNDGALPLDKGTSVSLFGQSVNNVVSSGSGSGATASSREHTYQTTLANAGLTVNEASWNFYNSGAGASYNMTIPSMHGKDPFSINECPWSVVQADGSYSQMINSDTALVVFSRNGGEGFDLPSGTNPIGPEGERYAADGLSQADGSLTGGNFLELNADERSVLAGVKALKDNGTVKNIVVVLNSPNAMEVDFLNPAVCGVDYGVDACLWMGPVGQSGLAALGQVLTGYNGDEQFSPSAKLIDTYAYDNLKEPAIYNYGESIYTNWDGTYASRTDSHSQYNQKYYTVYREGIYVGYRYHETRYEDYVFGNEDAYDYSEVVGYSFGHGLSYTTFEYSDFTATDNGDGTITASVTVTNTGEWAGKEVVEFYAQSPYTDYDVENGIEKASVELVGYDKTGLLAPGENETVTVTVEKEQLTAYDSNNAKTYIMDEGDYYLTFGNGAHDALNAIIEERENVEGLTAVEDRIVPASDPVNYSGSGRVFHWTEEFDAETYSTSSVTGAEITNQFDFADINKYSGRGDNSVEYVSRSDWMGTFDVTSLETMQATTVKLSMTDQMFDEVTNTWYEPAADASSYTMPTMGAKNGLTLAMFVGVPLDGTITLTNENGEVVTDDNGNPIEYTWDDLFDQMTYSEMQKLVLNGQHATAAVNSIAKPETKDENGPSGFNVTFVGGGGSGTAYPGPCMRAATWNQELVQRVGELMGEDGMAAGKNGMYGPAANTHRTAYGGRNFEYYSEDPFISSSIGASECVGIQSKGIIVYEKHFALNDAETHREGNGTWSNEQATREIYLEAFRGIMSSDQGNAHATMSGFNRLGTKWCGSSTELMNNVLRGEWGFDGFVATDMDNCNNNVLCTGYMYPAAAITGGTDIYDGVGNPANHNRANQLAEYRDDPYVMTKLREAAEHVVYAVANSAAMNGVSKDAYTRDVTPWWKATLIGATAAFAVLTVAAVAMWVLNATHVIAFPKPKKDRESAENVSDGK